MEESAHESRVVWDQILVALGQLLLVLAYAVKSEYERQLGYQVNGHKVLNVAQNCEYDIN